MLKSKSVFVVVGLGAALFSSMSFADVVTTGSETADTILQWLTSIVTVASLVANFTPSPVDNAGVKVLSLMVNILAANWKQLREAWKGVDKLAVGSLIVFAGLSLSDNASAATCDAAQIDNCPAHNLCVTFQPATTREGGAIYPVSEHKSIIIAVDGKESVIAPTATRFDYLVPKGEVLKAGAIISAWSVDTDNIRSSIPNTCTLAGAISGEKFPPAAPRLSVSAQ